MSHDITRHKLWQYWYKKNRLNKDDKNRTSKLNFCNILKEKLGKTDLSNFPL